MPIRYPPAMVIPGYQDRFAEDVSDEVHFWGHVPWAAGVPDSEYAPRNPDSVFALPETSRRLVTELLMP
jgi:hypothetical protein